MSAVPLATTSERWQARQVQVLVVLLLVVTSNYIDRSILGILQEPIKHDLKLTDWQLGLVGGPSFALFYALAGLPSARWSERADRRLVLPTILALWSAMTAACGLAQNFVGLALARAGVGLGEGGCIPISHSLISDHFPIRQRGKAIAILGTAPALGGFIAATAGSFIAQTWSWRIACMGIGLPGLALALYIRATLRDPRPKTGASQPRPIGRDLVWLLSNLSFLTIALANACASTANSGVLLFTASYFLRTYRLTLVQVGAIYATGIGVAGLLGSLASGWLADRFAGDRGRSYVLVPAFGAATAAVVFALAVTRDVWWMSAALLVPAYFMVDMKTPSLAAVQSLSPPHMRATSAAVLYLGITTCGTGLGGPLAGAVSDWIASSRLPAGWAALAKSCPGGRAPAGAIASVKEVCRAAGAAGVRGALLTDAAIFAVAALLFVLASRFIRLSISDPKGEGLPARAAGGAAGVEGIKAAGARSA